MKAYHLEKARDPSDLPEWLFSREELQAAGRRTTSSGRHVEEEGSYPDDRSPSPLPPRNRGLRDIYDAAAVANAPDNRSRGGGQDPTPSKAGDRLKALRDAKRNAVQRSALVTERETMSDRHSARSDGYSGGGERNYRERSRGPEGRQPPPRAGLPSRPGGQRF